MKKTISELALPIVVGSFAAFAGLVAFAGGWFFYTQIQGRAIEAQVEKQGEKIDEISKRLESSSDKDEDTAKIIERLSGDLKAFGAIQEQALARLETLAQSNQNILIEQSRRTETLSTLAKTIADLQIEARTHMRDQIEMRTTINELAKELLRTQQEMKELREKK